MRELVGLTAAQGTTIFFSSHQLAEVEQIADHIAIVDHGRTVVTGALDDLKVQYQRLRIVFPHEPVDVCWPDGAEHVRQEGRTVSILASRNIESHRGTGALAAGNFRGALSGRLERTLSGTCEEQLKCWS